MDIVSIGMVTPVGLTAPSSGAAIRAGISRLGASRVYDRKGQPIIMGLVRDDYLPPLAPSLRTQVGLLGRQNRMLRLAAPALQEVCRGTAFSHPLPLLLAVPDSARGQHIGSAFLYQLVEQAGVDIDFTHSRIIQHGRVGGLLALKEAAELLTTHRFPAVLIGGVDSYMDGDVLRSLDRADRLHRRLADGFVPGEASAFLMLRSSGRGADASTAPVARIARLGEGLEPGHLFSQKPHLGEGLSDAFRALWGPLSHEYPKVGCVYAGLNGERFWAKEWGVAYLRHSAHFLERLQIEHPIENIGDPGAALGPLLVGLAAMGIHRGYRRSPCLVWCGEDGASRAAVLVQNTTEAKKPGAPWPHRGGHV
jgi:3-oxoacyl-[acyl-carrier-protein] synthase-1